MRGGGYWVATIAGGLGASFAMDLVQATFAGLFERGRGPGDLDEEVEGIASVVHALSRVLPAVFPPGHEPMQARVVHYIFGVGFAGAYVAGVRRAPWLATSRGLAFGAGLFLLSDRVLIPALRLGRSWARYSRGERANALVSHLTYGLILELVRERYVV
jgi:hypothetical protein